MKKLTFAATLFVLGASMPAYAQEDTGSEEKKNIDWQEMETGVVTLEDIIRDKQAVNQNRSLSTHFEKVWGRRSYLNISYENSVLKPDQVIPTGVGNGKMADCKDEWGVTLTIGRNYRLHKRPIANVAQFNIDYTFFDLGVNQYKALDKGEGVYNSAAKQEGSDKYYTPWNLKKIEGSFGMSLGPSLTLAPFNYTKVSGLHYVKMNVYAHWGYHISALVMLNSHPEKADVNTANVDRTSFNNMKESSFTDWGHGLTSCVGFSISWKAIGLGYEHCNTSLKYKSTDTDKMGDDEYKFKTSQNRMYLQFRF